MNTSEIAQSLAALFSELIDGASATSYILNRNDPGLLRSLDRLDAAAASRLTPTGSSIAAHVDHLCYGLSLLDRWAAGEQNPWDSADWTASWRKTTVSDAEWQQLRARLGDLAHRWAASLAIPRDVNAIESGGVIGSVAHVAYHVGAIRQIDRQTIGPSEVAV